MLTEPLSETDPPSLVPAAPAEPLGWVLSATG